MNQRVGITLLAVALFGAAGCKSHSGNVGTPASPKYEFSDSSASLVIVPMASKAADLSRPELSVKGNSVSVNGIVRLKGGTLNPDAVMKIIVIDRRGIQTDEIQVMLKESDTLGVLSYNAHFAPVPPKGSSLAISYEDVHPTIANYPAANVGSGGAGSSAGKSSLGNSVTTGQGTRSTKGGGTRSARAR